MALLSLTFCADCDASEEVDSYKDCKDLTVEAGNTCCYVEFEGSVGGISGSGGTCESFDAEEMKDLDKLEEELERGYGGLVDYSIDCHSNYLSIAFLALLFILF